MGKMRIYEERGKHRVKWREDGKQNSKSFATLEEAEAFMRGYNDAASVEEPVSTQPAGEAPRYPYHDLMPEDGESAMKYRTRVIKAAKAYGMDHVLVGADGTRIVNPGCELELTEGEIEAHGGGYLGRTKAAYARSNWDAKVYATRMTNRGEKPWIGGSVLEYDLPARERVERDERRK